MADDDDIETGPEAGALAEDPDAVDEVDEDVEPDADELDEDFVVEEEAETDDDEVVADPETEEEDEDEAADAATTRTKRADEEEDEDEELLSPDDVEADLDRILKDRLVTADEEEDDEDEPEDRSEGGDRLQPKRADEQLCPNCFLLVRATAPGCPVGDDNCPIFGDDER